jgi:hypothetical protein
LLHGGFLYSSVKSYYSFQTLSSGEKAGSVNRRLRWDSEVRRRLQEGYRSNYIISYNVEERKPALEGGRHVG